MDVEDWDLDLGDLEESLDEREGPAVLEIPDFSEVCIVGGDLTQFNVARIGPDLKRIDLSFNQISRFKGIHVCSDTLEELILDNNHLEELQIDCVLPKLHTLTLNKNKISDLKPLLRSLKAYTPSLTYLSLLGNPCSPDQLSDDFVDDSDYQIYRYHVLHHLFPTPTLKFLDHKEVGIEERKEARKKLYENICVYPRRALKGSSSSSAASKRSSKQGKRRVKYLGKNSEGNRFIKDDDL